jgi:Zn-dependent protease
MPFDIIDFLRVLFVVLLSITIHEFAHALAAVLLGDDTPYYQGRLTLNPLAHLDPLGTIMIIMVMLGGIGLGWGRPVQINPSRLKYGPAVGGGIVAVAGPLSNLLIAIIAALTFHLSVWMEWLTFERGDPLLIMLLTFIEINIGLMLFNLIPIFPLDGFHVLRAILRLIRGRGALQLSHRLDSMAAYGPMLLMLLIVLGQLSPRFNLLRFIVGPPRDWLVSLLLGLF